MHSNCSGFERLNSALRKICRIIVSIFILKHFALLSYHTVKYLYLTIQDLKKQFTLENSRVRIHKISEMRKCPAVRLNVKETGLLIGYCKFSPTTIDRQNKNYESRFTNILILYLNYIIITKKSL